MNDFKKEGLLVLSYILVVFFANVNVPYFSLFTHPILLLVIVGIVYFSIKSELFKEHKMFALCGAYYKSLLLFAVYFSVHDYPGRDYIIGFSIIISVLYLVWATIKFRNKNQIIPTILYLNVFIGVIIGVIY